MAQQGYPALGGKNKIRASALFKNNSAVFKREKTGKLCAYLPIKTNEIKLKIDQDLSKN